MAKPVKSEHVLTSKGLVEAIPVEIVTSVATALVGVRAKNVRTAGHLGRKHGLDSQ